MKAGLPLTDVPEDVAAVATAIHDNNQMCAANYYMDIEECEYKDADVSEAMSVLDDLRKEGWRLVRDYPQSLSLFMPDNPDAQA